MNFVSHMIGSGPSQDPAAAGACFFIKTSAQKANLPKNILSYLPPFTIIRIKTPFTN